MTSLRFTAYHGRPVWIVPARILYVEDGGIGSRGAQAKVRLDTREMVTLNARAEDVQREIAAALDEDAAEIAPTEDDDLVRLRLNRSLPFDVASKILALANPKGPQDE